MSRPGHNSNSRFTLKPSEVRRLINACQDLRERILVRLMVHCDLRREETANLYEPVKSQNPDSFVKRSSYGAQISAA
jgi:hypothetical protein